MFYLPLALTSFVAEADRPIIAAGISRGLLPTESLAGWSVVISLISIFRGICFSTQEASIALFSTKENNRIIYRSVMASCLSVCSVCIFCTFIPQVRTYLLVVVSGLTPELAELCRLPLMVISLSLISFPAIAWLRAVNINHKTTRNIGGAVTMNLVVVILAVILLNSCFSMTGIMVASISYVLAMFADATYLTFKR